MSAPRLGLWQELGWLDRIDKAVSRPLFALTLPLPLEAALSVPGTFFGATTSSLGFIPIAIVVAAEHAVHGTVPTPYMLFASVAAVIVFGIHTMVCMRKLTREAMWLHPVGVLVLNLLLAYLLCGGEKAVGWRGLVLYACTWGSSQLLSHTIKLLVARRRPCAVLRDEIQRVPRHFRLSDHLRKGKSAIESFPSGDTAGAAAFAVIMVLITDHPGWLIIIIAAALGRVYFHAHHVLDVTAGAGLGVGITWLLGRVLTSWNFFGVYHFVGILVIFAVGWKLINTKLQPAVPEDLKPEAGSADLRG